MSAVLSATEVQVPGRLAPLSLTLEPGAVHALVGGNGSGKSTFLDCVLGVQPYQGRLEVAAPSLAVVPQRLELASSSPLTVLELFAASRRQRPTWLGVDARFQDETRAALRSLDAEALVTLQLSTLSGGELRRVLLALALASRPTLLLLDEPEAGLDAAARALLLGELEAAKARGQAVLWVSHDAAAVSALATSQTRLEAR